MPTQRDLERARDKVASFLEIATAPGASYASQKAALAGVRRELQRVGGNKVDVEDMVSISSRTTSDPAYRAAYLINAAQRMAESNKPHTQRVLSELDNYRKHVRADNQRLYGAQRLRAAMNSYGPIVGWYSRIDERTTPECREMNGKNFDPLEPPAAGLPGITHVNCRCRPGPPHPEADLVEASTNMALVRSRPSVKRSESDGVELSDLNWSPKKNWVEKRGGLPPYVVRIAKHLIAKGFERGHAIATAINVVKKMGKTGDLNWPGKQKANAKSRGEAVAATAHWERMKNMAEELAAEGLVEMATPNGKKGRGVYDGAYKIPPVKYQRGTATPKLQKPGAAPGTIPSPDPTVRIPKGGHLKQIAMGMTPTGGVPKRKSVPRSSATGKGPSDSTKVKMKMVQSKIGGAKWNPNALQSHPMGPNTDSGVKMKRAVGAPSTGAPLGTIRKKPVAKQAAKGSAQARPAHVAMSMTPGAPIKTSNTARAASVLKKIRSWGKPRKAKVVRAIKPTRIA